MLKSILIDYNNPSIRHCPFDFKEKFSRFFLCAIIKKTFQLTLNQTDKKKQKRYKVVNDQNASPKMFRLTVPEDNVHNRIDSFIAQQLPHYSRTFFQKLAQENYITLNGKSVKASSPIQSGDTIEIIIPSVEPLYHVEPSDELIAQLKQLPIEIIFDHPDFYIVNKPAGLMVHKPSQYSTALTLVDWLMIQSQALAHVGHPERPGIVHRLDKDTSGLIIIPKNNKAHYAFSLKFKNREIKKKYLAVVHGHPPPQGSIDFPIGRDRVSRNKMSINGIQPRSAATHYKVLQYLNNAALVEIYPITGRTHQIRVHLQAIGHGILGDPIYGHKTSHIKRQALHAQELSFTYNEQPFTFCQQPPTDFSQLVDILSK